MRRCRLLDRDAEIRVLPLVLIAWIPLFAATVVDIYRHDRTDSVAFDPVMHVRLLVTLPLLVAGEKLLDLRCGGAIRAMRRDAVLRTDTLDAILDRTEQLRDWWPVEVGLAIALVALGQIALWGVGGWSALVSGFAAHLQMTFATLWCIAFALPLVQFLIIRWLWRWALWTYVIVRMSRAPMSLNTLHPDRAGGIKALGTPIDGFAIYILAIASIFSAAWSTQIHHGVTTMPAVTPTFFALVVAAFIVAFGPLTLFATHLYRARYRDTVAYHGIARRYVDEFRRKWIEEPTGESPLATPDIQSLNDLGGSFRTSEETRMVPFSTRAVINLWLAALVPMLPVLLSSAPLAEIAMKFGKMLFGV